MWKLDGVVQAYAWGSKRFIPAWLGRPATSDPAAELWLGAHPRGPATVRTSPPTTLDAFIADDPQARLGAKVAARFADRLPFLLKILAAEDPLSIQAHPDRDQARAGFAREQAAGIPIDAPTRNYRDENHKPELIVALEPFEALVGFRQPAAIAAELRGLGLASDHPLMTDLAVDDLQAFFCRLMTLPHAERQRVTRTLIAKLGAVAHHRLVAKLHARYHDDIGVLAPIFLNFVELQPGEGLFLPPGQLHAYVGGAGLELMANSDNVLRGGLTPKHVDVAELSAILRFVSAEPKILRATGSDSRITAYDTPAAEFRLYRVAPNSTTVALPRPEALAIVAGSAGSITLTRAEQQLELSKGEAAVVPAGPTVSATGSGQLWLATIP